MIRFKSQDDLRCRGVYVVRQWTPGVIQKLLEKGVPQLEVEKIAIAAGAWRGEQVIKNLITDIGLQMIGDWAIDMESTGLTYHAIGTGNTPTSHSDAHLYAEYVRARYTSRSRAGNVTTVNAFYLGASVTIHIQEVGQFGGASSSAAANSGRLFSRVLYNYDNSVNGFDLTFDYNITPKNDPSNT